MTGYVDILYLVFIAVLVDASLESLKLDKIIVGVPWKLICKADRNYPKILCSYQ